jgi:hypothetical protein
MIKLSVSRKKIEAEHLHKSKNGDTYLNLVLFDKEDDYGNDGFVVQDISKEAREAGGRGPIVGNWRHLVKKDPAPAKASAPATPSQPATEVDDDIPF